MNPTDAPENPWKRRKKPGLYFFPPSRAILAELKGRKAVATWGFKEGRWICIAANQFLKWMRGLQVNSTRQADEIRGRLRHYEWQWIDPLYAERMVQPPF